MIVSKILSHGNVTFPLKDGFQKAILSAAAIDEYAPRA
jgi:hypothetical protein